MSLLSLDKVNNGYGNKPVIFDINIKVEKGEIVSLIGPNGSGKSTVLKTISGILPSWSGNVIFDTTDISRVKAHGIVKHGISFSPQGNRVFDELTVKENLEIGGFILLKKELNERIENVLEFFPGLSAKLKNFGGELSGGEQQMLSVARAIMPKPKFLMLDEPSLGIQPNLLTDMFEKLKELNNELNLTILIVEQKVKDVLKISNRTYSLKLGKVFFEGPSKSLVDNEEELKKLFL
jgi:branched-chain amino acid transport system ATP-binding protein